MRFLRVASPVLACFPRLIHTHASHNIGNKLQGISHIGVTTGNLERSTLFYTKVLGGRLLSELSGLSVCGNGYYERIFKKELKDAERLGVQPEEIGVPNIGAHGNYQLRWNLVQMDNLLIKLQQFEQKDGSSVFEFRQKGSSPALIPNQHICLWVQDTVDIQHYIRELEHTAQEYGFNKVVVNRHNGLPGDSMPHDRRHQKAIVVTEGEIEGAAFTYLRGPSGEQLEVYQTRGTEKGTTAREYRNGGGVSTAFLHSYSDNVYKTTIPSKLFGLHHYGLRTHNLDESVRFYTEVLGGRLCEDPMLSDDFYGDQLYFTMFGDLLHEAKLKGVDPSALAVPDISDNGKVKISLRFVMFDNCLVELIDYSEGFSPRFDHTSPSAINSMQLGFHVDESIPLEKFVQTFTSEAAEKGFHGITANPVSQEKDNGYDNNGYCFVGVKGPSGEQIVFSQYQGEAKKVLRKSIIDYGGVSKLFPDTNPYTYDGYSSTFASLPPKNI